MQKLLIVGLGDIARRALPELLKSWHVTALTRDASNAPVHPNLRVVALDLDASKWSASQEAVLCASYDVMVWTVPPNASADNRESSRLRRVANLWASAEADVVLRRIVYISTTGVYGDCGGAWVDEEYMPNPESARAVLRMLDEMAVGDLGYEYGAQTTILRAPGIYALERLPVNSLLQGSPVMRPDEDGFSNHIHADDLAGAIVYALNEVEPLDELEDTHYINVCDDEPILMGQWFEALAQVLGLPAPNRLTRAEMAQSVDASRWSFMRESRQVSNAKMKAWGYQLRHPSALAFLRAHADTIRAQFDNREKNA